MSKAPGSNKTLSVRSMSGRLWGVISVAPTQQAEPVLLANFQDPPAEIVETFQPSVMESDGGRPRCKGYFSCT